MLQLESWRFPPAPPSDDTTIALVVEKKGDESGTTMKQNEIYAFSPFFRVGSGIIVMPKDKWKHFNMGDWFECKKNMAPGRDERDYQERELTNIQLIPPTEYKLHPIPKTHVSCGRVYIETKFVLCPEWIKNRTTSNMMGTFAKLLIFTMGQGFINIRSHRNEYTKLKPGRVYGGVFEFHSKDNDAINFACRNSDDKDETGHPLELDTLWQLVELRDLVPAHLSDSGMAVPLLRVEEDGEMNEYLTALKMWAPHYAANFEKPARREVQQGIDSAVPSTSNRRRDRSRNLFGEFDEPHLSFIPPPPPPPPRTEVQRKSSESERIVESMRTMNVESRKENIVPSRNPFRHSAENPSELGANKRTSRELNRNGNQVQNEVVGGNATGNQILNTDPRNVASNQNSSAESLLTQNGIFGGQVQQRTSLDQNLQARYVAKKNRFSIDLSSYGKQVQDGVRNAVPNRESNQGAERKDTGSDNGQSSSSSQQNAQVMVFGRQTAQNGNFTCQSTSSSGGFGMESENMEIPVQTRRIEPIRREKMTIEEKKRILVLELENLKGSKNVQKPLRVAKPIEPAETEKPEGSSTVEEVDEEAKEKEAKRIEEETRERNLRYWREKHEREEEEEFNKRHFPTDLHRAIALFERQRNKVVVFVRSKLGNHWGYYYDRETNEENTDQQYLIDKYNRRHGFSTNPSKLVDNGEQQQTRSSQLGDLDLPFEPEVTSTPRISPVMVRRTPPVTWNSRIMTRAERVRLGNESRRREEQRRLDELSQGTAANRGEESNWR